MESTARQPEAEAPRVPSNKAIGYVYEHEITDGEEIADIHAQEENIFIILYHVWCKFPCLVVQSCQQAKEKSRCLFLVQSLHLGLALLLGSLFLGHLLGNGGSGVRVKGRHLVLDLVLDGLDGELLLALWQSVSVMSW